MAPRHPHPFRFGLQMPSIFLGSVDQTDKLTRLRRDRYGFCY
jgi:hypothetical protein